MRAARDRGYRVGETRPEIRAMSAVAQLEKLVKQASRLQRATTPPAQRLRFRPRDEEEAAATSRHALHHRKRRDHELNNRKLSNAGAAWIEWRPRFTALV